MRSMRGSARRIDGSLYYFTRYYVRQLFWILFQRQLSTEIVLQSYGVTVEYAVGQYEDSPEGRLLKGLVSEFAEYERDGYGG